MAMAMAMALALALAMAMVFNCFNHRLRCRAGSGGSGPVLIMKTLRAILGAVVSFIIIAATGYAVIWYVARCIWPEG